MCKGKYSPLVLHTHAQSGPDIHSIVLHKHLHPSFVTYNSGPLYTRTPWFCHTHSHVFHTHTPQSCHMRNTRFLVAGRCTYAGKQERRMHTQKVTFGGARHVHRLSAAPRTHAHKQRAPQISKLQPPAAAKLFILASLTEPLHRPIFSATTAFFAAPALSWQRGWR